MAERRIVPDCSVLVPAYFPETVNLPGRAVDLSPPAKRLRNAIDTREVIAFAPELLVFEFLAAAGKKASTRHGVLTFPVDDVQKQVERFLSLWNRIVWIPWHQLVDSAWDLTTTSGLAPPDSWYLACAQQYDAELWISHEHGDGFANHARLVHDRVFTLTDDAFDGV